MSRVDEWEEQIGLLHSERGRTGSGKARYAAAMSLYNAGLMSEALLELFRRCSPLDHEDPFDLAAFEGVAVNPLLLRVVRKTS